MILEEVEIRMKAIHPVGQMATIKASGVVGTVLQKATLVVDPGVLEVQEGKEVKDAVVDSQVKEVLKGMHVAEKLKATLLVVNKGNKLDIRKVVLETGSKMEVKDLADKGLKVSTKLDSQGLVSKQVEALGRMAPIRTIVAIPAVALKFQEVTEAMKKTVTLVEVQMD